MKLKAPEDMGGFCFKGVPVDIDKNGHAEASTPEMEAEMRAHGFTDLPVEVPKAKARRSAE